ncbi:carboxymuconolactone decarboxylase family protein [Catenulispora yoronensis]|uniref:Carboxymuconolactone decarboxylase family protein n=1 Tax=Catenulispora yoronensis TaxID=450799 RepID=A0ABP5FYC4_9ACTN
MAARLNAYENPALSKVYKYFIAANQALVASPLPTEVRHLVEIRASQINGCGFCVDMHTKDAAAAGETQQRINLVAVWRDATVFTEAERVALELTEAGTRLADTAGVGEELWAAAAAHFDEEQLGALVAAIALINAFNRGNVLTTQPAGDYVPGQFN